MCLAQNRCRKAAKNAELAAFISGRAYIGTENVCVRSTCMCRFLTGQARPNSLQFAVTAEPRVEFDEVLLARLAG